jgi:hypothetical protein
MREFCKTLMQRVAALFRGRRLEEELDAEVRSHLEIAESMNLRKGISRFWRGGTDEGTLSRAERITHD